MTIQWEVGTRSVWKRKLADATGPVWKWLANRPRAMGQLIADLVTLLGHLLVLLAVGFTLVQSIRPYFLSEGPGSGFGATIFWVLVLLVAVALAFSLKSLQTLLRATKKFLGRLTKARIWVNDTFAVESVTHESLVDEVAVDGGRLLYSRAANERLSRGSRIDLKIEIRQAFSQETYQRRALGKLLSMRDGIAWNGKKLRLRSDRTLFQDDCSVRLPVQPCGYYDGLVTNDCAQKTITWDNESHQVSELFSAKGVLRDLDDHENGCANTVCVSTLALTSDGYLIAIRQSHWSNISAGLLVPSGSGSMDQRDMKKVHDEHVRAATERELAEECGWSTRRCPRLSTRLIGYGRFVHRGGKPEFFAFTVVDCSWKMVRHSLRESWFHEKFFFASVRPSTNETPVAKLRRVARELADCIKQDIPGFGEIRSSINLVANARFLVDFLDLDQGREAVRFLELAGYLGRS